MNNRLFLSRLLWIDIFFVALTNKKLLLPLLFRLNTNLFPDYVKLLGYFASAVNVVPSNPCVRPFPRIKISFSLLSICKDELISIPKMITILPTPPSGK